ncbi:hypothetical protein, partial [Stutzerimonas nitrititolerans]|uniref:hypothetical protein n=1 Tax=Stutzerimonas nitrititolerans TaxID=2482751 RepID=UPI0028988E22
MENARIAGYGHFLFGVLLVLGIAGKLIAEHADTSGFALLGEFLLAVAPKETKRSCPSIRPCAARR